MKLKDCNSVENDRLVKENRYWNTKEKEERFEDYYYIAVCTDTY